MILDDRREALDAQAVLGPVRVDDSLKLKAPTTGSTTSDLNVDTDAGVVVIAGKVQQFNAKADIDCGSSITDGESLPVAVVAYYNPDIDKIVIGTVTGTSHTTPAAEADSRAYYPSDATIEASIPEAVGKNYTHIGVVVFKRATTTITQHIDHTVRSYGVVPASKLGAGDEF